MESLSLATWLLRSRSLLVSGNGPEGKARCSGLLLDRHRLIAVDQHGSPNVDDSHDITLNPRSIDENLVRSGRIHGMVMS